VVLDCFITSESRAEKIHRDNSLAVGKTNQFNQSRILAQIYQQMDAQKSAKDYDNMEPKTFMAMMVATFSKQGVQLSVSFC
jgi:hypothetical protein